MKTAKVLLIERLKKHQQEQVQLSQELRELGGWATYIGSTLGANAGIYAAWIKRLEWEEL